MQQYGIRNKNPRFQKHLNKDFDLIIFNLNEFGRWFVVNGKRILGVLTTNSTGTTDQGSRDMKNYGLTTRSETFYCKSEDLPAKFLKASNLTINNSEFHVEKVEDRMGIVCFTLSKTVSKGVRF